MFKTKVKAFFLILIVSLIILLVMPLITQSIQSTTVVAFIFYFILTLISIKVFSKKLSAGSIVWIVFATLIVIQSFTIYTWFVWDTFGLPAVAGHCFAIISAYFYSQWNAPQKFLPVFLSTCFVAFMFFQGWDYWLYKINYGSFTGKIQTFNLPATFEVSDEQNNLVTEENFRNKIVLLDFWFTKCAVCFEKFPQVQATYDRYKNDPSVAIFAVDKPIEEDTPGQAFQVIKDEGYTFPVVIAKDEELPEKFGVKYYPTTFVIDRSGQIVFKGDIAGAVKMLEELKRSER